VKLESPSVARNRDALAAALADWLPAWGTVLEVASGSGEHALHFARRFPHLRFQPSDPDAEARASIAAYAEEAALPNLHSPLALDVLDAAAFPAADAVLCINMIHIAPADAIEGLLRHAAAALAPGAPLLLYGPFLRDGVPTAPSNLDFDRSLRERDARWGLRRLEDVAALARPDFDGPEIREMPANNLLVRFRRR
jgi:SAM-dependent methyltransferase